MGTPTAEEFAAKPRKALDTIFATGPDGKIYEIPSASASEFLITPERVKELGHLPITPYTKLASAISPVKDEEEAEVGGRHKVYRNGRMVWHHDWEYGTYRWVCDGRYYTGWHCHPWGDIDAADQDNF